MNAVVCFVVLAVVRFTTTESVGTRMRREHVEWWNALLEDFQRQVSRAMTSVVESCEQPQLLVNTNITREILEEIQQIRSEIKSIELELEGHTSLTLKEIQQIRSEIKQLNGLDLGEGWRFPAFSCKEIAERKPNSSSGFYWLQNCASSSPVLVYCDLEKEFPTGTKGWMRVANLNMTDPNQQCPTNFNLYTQPKRLRGKSTDGNGCDSIKFTSSGLQVCGRVVGYQLGSPDGFHAHFCSDCTINKAYVDGISITYGIPRKHIWTLAAGLYETEHLVYNCPCSSPAGRQPPSFLGSDYYCESGIHMRPYSTSTPYTDDALWDGEGCDANEAPCCIPPDLPWFCKELPEPTSNDLEVRVCTDEPLSNEDVPIEVIELYLQ